MVFSAGCDGFQRNRTYVFGVRDGSVDAFGWFCGRWRRRGSRCSSRRRWCQLQVASRTIPIVGGTTHSNHNPENVPHITPNRDGLRGKDCHVVFQFKCKRQIVNTILAQSVAEIGEWSVVHRNPNAVPLLFYKLLYLVHFPLKQCVSVDVNFDGCEVILTNPGDIIPIGGTGKL